MGIPPKYVSPKMPIAADAIKAKTQERSVPPGLETVIRKRLTCFDTCDNNG
jgi:hypothetical protein